MWLSLHCEWVSATIEGRGWEELAQWAEREKNGLSLRISPATCRSQMCQSLEETEESGFQDTGKHRTQIVTCNESATCHIYSEKEKGWLRV